MSHVSITLLANITFMFLVLHQSLCLEILASLLLLTDKYVGTRLYRNPQASTPVKSTYSAKGPGTLL